MTNGPTPSAWISPTWGTLHLPQQPVPVSCFRWSETCYLLSQWSLKEWAALFHTEGSSSESPRLPLVFSVPGSLLLQLFSCNLISGMNKIGIGCSPSASVMKLVKLTLLISAHLEWVMIKPLHWRMGSCPCSCLQDTIPSQGLQLQDGVTLKISPCRGLCSDRLSQRIPD